MLHEITQKNKRFFLEIDLEIFSGAHFKLSLVDQFSDNFGYSSF